jgi:tetratricopeptide (TPR) repeat protein
MYEDLVKTWDRRGLLPLHVGMTDRKFATERENMRIWSARYLALTGGYQKALVALAMARQKLVSMMGSGVGSKKAKLDLLAESFHVEAFRVLIEQKKYAQASEVYLFAVKNHDFAATWKAKFLWYAGLFAHISGDSSLALQHWSRVAGFDPKETYQSKILFWSAKAYLALGKKRRARDLWKELKKESAIGYYTLVVGRNLAIENGWDAEVMSSLVAEAKPYALSETMQEDIIRIAGRDLWERYLLASNIGASKWTRLVGFEILARLKNKRKFIRNTDFAREFYALLSSTGLHYKHIYFQTLLSNKVDDFWRRYPRQFSVYFPATYAKRISESIDRIHGTTVDKNLVLGLVRQESSFRETVGSGAGAYGLMQITPSTARGLEPKWAGKSETFVQSKLREADSNLKLGIKNLDKLARKYSKFGGLAEAAILSAYNAGEEVTDRWLSYRRVKDPDAWTELVPFGETQKYIKFVTRNQTALRLIGKTSQQLSAQ